MYKVLLCWRYLRTRYLALLCIVSVMLGVATLIVVNSVMGGFSKKLRERLHGLLSDVVIEAWGMDGFHDPEGKMARIRSDPFLRKQIDTMTPVLESFAMLQHNYRGQRYVRAVRLIGVNAEARARLGGFREHLVHNGDKDPFHLSLAGQKRQQFLHPPNWFRFHRGGFEEVQEPVAGPPLPFEWREDQPGAGNGVAKPPPAPPPSREFHPEKIILGYAIAHYRKSGASADPNQQDDVCLLHVGDDVVVTTVSGGKLTPVWARFVVCDYFRSEMSEYDSNYAFVPLQYLQELRTMENRATAIQIRLKDYSESKEVVKRLRTLFAKDSLSVHTWEEKQGPLLAAIRVERGLLNVLLFLIVAVAGFGILSIFSMIVVEKTRDIGILKALGASNGGVMKIFLGYGLLLGVVGALLGTALGITLTVYINEVEWALAKMTGQEIFPRGIYYFDQIPTHLQPLNIVLLNLGAVAIAIIFSVLPALRAAMLHPVQALRYE